MLPARRFNGQYGLTDFFNDFFENRSLEKVEFTTPAINVKENDTEYKIEVAAPGACKDDFKVHLNERKYRSFTWCSRSCRSNILYKSIGKWNSSTNNKL